MIGEIKVNGIHVYAYHGCLQEESKIGGKYIINVSLFADLADAASKDELSSTVDYVTVNAIVVREMKVRASLIEHVCKRICDSLRIEFPQLKKFSVEVIKVAPPINGNVEDVSVTLNWERGST